MTETELRSNQIFDVEQMNVEANQGGLRTELAQLGTGVFRHHSWKASAPDSGLLYLQSSVPVEARGEIVAGTISLRAPCAESRLSQNGISAGSGEWLLVRGGSETMSTNAGGRFFSSGSLEPANGLVIFNVADAKLRAVLGRLDADAPLIPSSAVLLHPDPKQSYLFWQLIAAWRRADDEHHRAEMADSLLGLLANVLDVQSQKGAPRLQRRERYRLLVRAMDLIDAHHAEPMDIPALCSSLGVPHRSLCRLFDEVLGMGPKKYLTHRRLHHIRSDLISAARSEHSISRIAADHGMSHFGRFSSQFRDHYGKAPSQFRSAVAAESAAV